MMTKSFYKHSHLYGIDLVAPKRKYHIFFFQFVSFFWIRSLNEKYEPFLNGSSANIRFSVSSCLFKQKGKKNLRVKVFDYIKYRTQIQCEKCFQQKKITALISSAIILAGLFNVISADHYCT